MSISSNNSSRPNSVACSIDSKSKAAPGLPTQCLRPAKYSPIPACRNITLIHAPAASPNWSFALVKEARNRVFTLLRALEFGHSGRPELGERSLVLSGGSGLDHGLAGSGGVAGGKGHRIVGQLLAQERNQVQTRWPFGSAAPFGQGRIDLSSFGAIAL